MVSRILFAACLCAVFCCLVLAPTGTPAQQPSKHNNTKDIPGMARVFDWGADVVHNVGNLLLHTGNWGAIGSKPSAAVPYSGQPSAEYPAGSGVQYIYEGGLWIGAVRGGIPAVSTSSYAAEFRPTSDPVDVMYHAAKGDPGGATLPDPGADDDGDGKIDEEWLDGHDNDADGLTDEDFAAYSNQMFSCWYSDTTAAAAQIYPQHNALGLLVHQRSFQWADPAFDDFVGFDYTITNVGAETLEDVYVGFFVDGDVGTRSTPDYWGDDAVGYIKMSPIVCTEWGAVNVEYAYWYDADGDGGQATSHCGILLLDHTTDPSGVTAPADVGFSTVAFYRGAAPFPTGPPTNDFERYEAMSSHTIQPIPGLPPADVQTMVSVGPFPELAPGQSLSFKMAIVAGDAPGGSPNETTLHAAAAKIVQQGQWFDVDDNPLTGIAGRETPVWGPASDVEIDRCNNPGLVIPFVPAGQVVWTNEDCEREAAIKGWCGYSDEDSLLYVTGSGGREQRAPWLLPDDIYVPVLITGLNVETSRTSATVSWRIQADETVRGFRLLRASRDGRDVMLPHSGLIPVQARSYIDNDVSAGQKYEYTLFALLENGSQVRSGTVGAAIPAEATILDQNYPNPFNPNTTISFTLSARCPVTLTVYTIEGKKVVTLVDEILPAGAKQVSWNGKDTDGNAMSTGVYFYRLKAGKEVFSRKMILMK